MDEYDIWNGYELFCLLKNTLNVGGRSLSDIEVMFRRIPVMIIGDGDEEKQIVRLVKELSPIEYWDFYEAYEERYGLRKESAMCFRIIRWSMPCIPIQRIFIFISS